MIFFIIFFYSSGAWEAGPDAWPPQQLSIRSEQRWASKPLHQAGEQPRGEPPLTPAPSPSSLPPASAAPGSATTPAPHSAPSASAPAPSPHAPAAVPGRGQLPALWLCPVAGLVWRRHPRISRWHGGHWGSRLVGRRCCAHGKEERSGFLADGRGPVAAGRRPAAVRHVPWGFCGQQPPQQLQHWGLRHIVTWTSLGVAARRAYDVTCTHTHTHTDVAFSLVHC